MTAATSASTTSRSTRLARWRESAMSSNLRQRSEISLSLASVFSDQREHAQIGAERRGERMGGRLALLLVGILQFGEQRLERQLLALEGEAQRGDGVVEQPVPGGDARHRLLQEQLLDFVGELVRALLADVLEPRTIMGERRAAHRRVERGVVEAIELEFEEQQILPRASVTFSCASP